MDLKELCEKVDRIAVLERCEPQDITVEHLAVKKRSRSRNPTHRYVQ